MRSRLALVVVLAFALPLALAAAATASPPVVSTIEVDSTRQSQFWSTTCGVPVFFHQEGTLTFRLFPDSNVIHEVDTFPGFTITVFSPVEEGGTGKSFTYLLPAPIHFLYPEGTDLGDPGIGIFTGAIDVAAPGGPVIAGRQVLAGVIVDHTPEGIPIVDFAEELSTSGHFPEFEEFAAARCAFLTDP
jgi:hypothetical protein